MRDGNIHWGCPLSTWGARVVMCGGSWIRMVDRDLMRSARFVTVHPLEKTRNITRVIILAIILVIAVDLSFYHILSYSIILSFQILLCQITLSLACHWFTVLVGDWKTGCGSNPPFDSSQPANFCWLQSVSTRLRNNHVAVFSNMFYIVLPSKRKQLPFFLMVHGVYI